MNFMEFKELKKKKISDLHTFLSETREKLRSLRFKDAAKQLKNVREIRQTRKLISQTLMLIRSKNDEVKKESEPVNE